MTVLDNYAFNLQPHRLATTVWASLISLAAILRIIYLFSFPVFTKRFQFNTSAPHLRVVSWYNPRRVSPFGNIWIKADSGLPKSYRSLSTSFIAIQNQGIHHIPLTLLSGSVKLFLFDYYLLILFS